MLPGKKYTPEDAIDILRRRRWIILAPFAVGLALLPLLARVVPEKYRSETLILVEPQRVPDSYVKPTVTEAVEDRLPAISEQILSRSRLERIITELGLYAEERQRTVMEDIVRRMRDQDIRLDLGPSSPDEDINSFRISYVSNDPVIAQKVTERLASMTLEQNSLDRQARAQSTDRFLESQLQEAKRQLVEHEAKLEEYKRRYSGELPSQLQGNLHAISSAQLQLQSLSETVAGARQRRLLIERQIADTEALPPTPPPPAVASAEPAPLSTAQRLEAAERQLDAFRLRYTPDHPNVRAIERVIAELRVKLEEEGTGPTPVAPERPLSAAELAHQKKLLELKAELDVIDVQLSELAVEEKRLKASIGQYQAKVDLLPARESELVELTRDYETLDAGYRSLLAKWQDSKIAANLEAGQIGEQFRIVDTASLPQRPFNQMQRVGVSLSGAGAGLLLGLLIVGLLEYRDSSFKREEDVLRALSVPVLALVPAVTSVGEQRRVRRRSMAMDVFGVVLLLASVAVVVVWRP